jgi:hypothetical protein
MQSETYIKGLLFPALVCIFYCSALLLNVTEWDFTRMGTAKTGKGGYMKREFVGILRKTGFQDKVPIMEQ